jgi:hypothetical protein
MAIEAPGPVEPRDVTPALMRLSLEADVDLKSLRETVEGISEVEFSGSTALPDERAGRVLRGSGLVVALARVSGSGVSPAELLPELKRIVVGSTPVAFMVESVPSQGGEFTPATGRMEAVNTFMTSLSVLLADARRGYTTPEGIDLEKKDLYDQTAALVASLRIVEDRIGDLRGGEVDSATVDDALEAAKQHLSRQIPDFSQQPINRGLIGLESGYHPDAVAKLAALRQTLLDPIKENLLQLGVKNERLSFLRPESLE